MSRRKVLPGDIFEIPTKRGLAYAQYVFKKPEFGALIRVLPGLHAARPEQFEPTVVHSEQFVTFFPLQAAVEQNVFEIVAHERVPEASQKFPLFRAAGHIDREGFIHDWWL